MVPGNGGGGNMSVPRLLPPCCSATTYICMYVCSMSLALVAVIAAFEAASAAVSAAAVGCYLIKSSHEAHTTSPVPPTRNTDSNRRVTAATATTTVTKNRLKLLKHENILLFLYVHN